MKQVFLFLLSVLVGMNLFLDKVIAAELMQVTSSSVLLIGDNNRTYKVQIACIEVDRKNEINARNWLKDNLPRSSKVNLRPKGFEDGVLISNVISVKKNINLGEQLISEGYAISTCN
tara:strand:- start:124 stop:474 length:351 start_codon:yes stop_codon:yes gene_type:complete